MLICLVCVTPPLGSQLAITPCWCARLGRSAPPQRTEHSEGQAVFDEKASRWRLWQHRRLVPSRWRSCGVDSSRWQRIRQQPLVENQTVSGSKSSSRWWRRSRRRSWGTWKYRKGKCISLSNLFAECGRSFTMAKLYRVLQPLQAQCLQEATPIGRATPPGGFLATQRENGAVWAW